MAGALLYGQDRIEGSANATIRGYFVQGELHPAGWLAPFARYDWVRMEDPAEGVDTVSQVTVGSSLRLFMTDVTAGRAVVELSRSSQGGAHVNGALLNLLWAF